MNPNREEALFRLALTKAAAESLARAAYSANNAKKRLNCGSRHAKSLKVNPDEKKFSGHRAP